MGLSVGLILVLIMLALVVNFVPVANQWGKLIVWVLLATLVIVLTHYHYFKL